MAAMGLAVGGSANDVTANLLPLQQLRDNDTQSNDNEINIIPALLACKHLNLERLNIGMNEIH